MANIKKKTYDNTFLFSLPGEMAKHHNHISSFIVSSERIENKRSDAFRGVVEDIKRYQKSAIIYQILLREDVVLCVNDVEMPPVFKVFMAKDSKSNGDKRVFIDVTGIIDFKNGSYYCKNIQKLITYLFQAITWLLYEYETEAFLNNSNVTLSSTDCFVKMFDYVLGYFRFYGFAENRTKINYLTALYFMINILGKDDDQYTNQVAAKLTRVDQSLTKSYSLYYEREDLANIDTFITLLTDTFKLKGLNTEVFINRWITNCGNATYFATELFPAFCNMMIGAYCGANVVKQQTIEKQCSSSMIKLCEEILRLGSTHLFKGKGIMEAQEEFDNIVVRSASVKKLQEEARIRNSKSIKLSIDDCSSMSKTKSALKEMTDYYKASGQENKLGDKTTAFAILAINSMDKNDRVYGENVLPTIIEEAIKHYLSPENKRAIIYNINNSINSHRDNIRDLTESNQDTGNIVIELKDLMEAKNLI